MGGTLTGPTTVMVVYSHIVGLAVIRSLGRRGVPVVVLHYLPVEMGHVSKYAREHFRITSPAKDEGAFIRDILALSDRYRRALLVPTDDYTLVALSKYKDRLERHFDVLAQDWSLIKKVVNKQYTYELAERIGVPYPKTIPCDRFEDVERRIPEFQFPCILKPREGHQFFEKFRKKVLVVRNSSELKARSRELRGLGMSVMLQEIIPGAACEGVNYNSYFVGDEPIAEFTAEKVRVDPPFFGSPRVIVSKWIPQIIEPGRKLLKALGYQGFSCIEFKRDIRDGVYKLMEINARHNLSGSLAVACGIDFPWIMYRHRVWGEKISVKIFRENIHWIDLTRDVMRFFVSRKQEGYSFGEYLFPYWHKPVYAILDLKDPIPFVKRCLDILKKSIWDRSQAYFS
jgi:predicted ATP-grasp superfamily ATP-dependent carboligase